MSGKTSIANTLQKSVSYTCLQLSSYKETMDMNSKVNDYFLCPRSLLFSRLSSCLLFFLWSSR